MSAACKLAATRSQIPPRTTCGECRFLNDDRRGVLPGWGVCQRFGEAAHLEGGCIWGRVRSTASLRVVGTDLALEA